VSDLEPTERRRERKLRRGGRERYTMGRTSKFSFPYPGRKHATREKESKVMVQTSVAAGHNISKAQKILGTPGDLNIDSPIREFDDGISWRSFNPPSSSGMSFAISESTQQDSFSYASNSTNWDGESLDGQLRAKASSTVLGHFQDEVSTDASSIRRKLHTERSISTLRSYYDPQNAPPSVSQQTSASSARDLALRKGFPPVTQYPRSPLLQEDSLDGEESYYETYPHTPTSTISQSSKKKPARLDLTKLFPKPRKDGGPVLGKEYVTRSPSVYSQESSSTRYSDRDGPRKLTKTDSRSKKLPKAAKDEQSQTSSVRRHRKDRLSNVYEGQESFSRSPPIPERKSSRQNLHEPAQSRTQRDEHQPSKSQSRDGAAHRSTEPGDQFSWANIRASLASSPWETRSVASNSSFNTKGSRHTSTSIMSNSDLRNQSVLSISSDSDSDEIANVSESRSNQQNAAPRPTKQPTRKTSRGSHVADDCPATNSNAKASVPARVHGIQDSNFLTIPPPRLAGSRLSGPWNPKPNKQNAASPRYDSDSIASGGSSKSKNLKASKSKENQKAPGRDSRLMTVTKQEEALLEALRLKKARMKEAIIAEHEHEIKKSPLRGPPPRHAARDSNCSELTIRGDKRNDTQRVLLYLDEPVSFARGIDTAEPSPDLSDFLSFGSDEDDDSTPRTSWIVAKDRARADSVTSPESETRDSPKTPQSAARLSAVGAPGVVGGDQRGDGRKGVTFLEGVQSAGPEFLDDIDVVWGL
jgi:hypothetical protein